MDALGAAGILGLTCSTDVGGGGQGLDAAADVITRLAEVCGSTAMVVLMHYAATAVIEAHGPEASAGQIAAGRHLTTLAFSEVGSRSHFWAPLGHGPVDGDEVRLDAQKSWVTAAGEADSYVWSSRPVDRRRSDDAVARTARDAPGLRARGRSTGSACAGTARRR